MMNHTRRHPSQAEDALTTGREGGGAFIQAAGIYWLMACQVRTVTSCCRTRQQEVAKVNDLAVSLIGVKRINLNAQQFCSMRIYENFQNVIILAFFPQIYLLLSLHVCFWSTMVVIFFPLIT